MSGAVTNSVDSAMLLLRTLTLVGLIDAVNVVLGKYSESVTVPEKPLMLVTVIVEVDDAPCTVHIVEGLSVMRNDPGSLLAEFT